MTREFIEIDIFRKSWYSKGLTDDDMERLEHEIASNPKIGRVISNANGCRKMRFALEGRSKSRSVRVIYLDIPSGAHTWLLAVYLKNEQDNITDEQCLSLSRMAKMIKDIYKSD